jgi:hypothetical protein
MRKRRMRNLTVAGLGILAVILYAPVLWAEPPVSEVILESYSEPNWATGLWEGPATIWIDGIKYEGEIIFSGDGHQNINSYHGTEVKVYDFGGLGMLEVSGTNKTTFAYVSPEHRWHRYTSHVQITNGTGAFANAHGVFQFVGYTDWLLNPAGPPDAYAFEGTQAKIVGIEVD